MATLTAEQRARVQDLAARMRRDIITMITEAKSGHPGGSLSITDALALLYEVVLRVDPQQPKMPNRDRVVLSKGHAAPGLYAVLAEKGYFPKEELLKLRKIDAMLQGHPDMKHTPGVEMTTGSLGQGFSASCGMALAAKNDGRPFHVYAFLGDGELQEGQVWEAAMFAGHYGLDTLTILVDNNGLQIDGDVTQVMNPLPIAEKFRAFRWHVLEVCGHDLDELYAAIQEAQATLDQPTAIVMKTVKGKGFARMENNAGWHGKAPTREEYEELVAEWEGR